MPRAKTDTSHLRDLREQAGLSLRELARQIGEQPSNLTYWETNDTLPRANVLIPMAQALGVSVEELLGAGKARKNGTPGGRLGRTFAAVSKLPRRQQAKILDVVDALVAQENGS